MVSTEAPDLILLDIRMPGIDGYETCIKLKENPETENYPVIFVSANDSEEEIMAGYEVGGVDYLVKPFIPAELRQKVNLNLDALDKKKALEQRLTETSKVAFQALTDTSIYGAISQFLIDTLKCESFGALAERLFQLTSEWGLKCTLQINAEEATKTFFDTNIHNPLEEKVLFVSVGKGRIFDFGMRTIINMRHSSLLVKNMPLDDEMRYGSYKDYLASLCEGVDGRVAALITENMVSKRNEQIKHVFLFLLESFKNIEKYNYDLRVRNADIIEQMNENLQLTVNEIGVTNELNEDSEHRILDVGSKTLQRTNDLFSEGLYFNEQIEKLINSFDETLSNKSMSESDMSNLVASLESLDLNPKQKE